MNNQLLQLLNTIINDNQQKISKNNFDIIFHKCLNTLITKN